MSKMVNLTADQVSDITNSVMDFYFKGPAIKQLQQDRTLLNWLRANQKTFPGGKELIRGNVKGGPQTEFVGYSYDDTVTYRNPTGLKQFQYEWFEHHAGLTVTHTELKQYGINVIEDGSGEERTSNVAKQDLIEITNGLTEKLDDMTEGVLDSLQRISWLDGTQSAKVFPGVTALVRAAPNAGIVGGIDSAANSWWRNRAAVGVNKITASPSAQTATKFLRGEMRQLRRFGGKPTGWFAGSDAIEALESEISEKGIYTQEGFQKSGATEIGMADITMRGIGKCQYDPFLDDLGLSDFMFFLDPRHLFLMVMEGQDMKRHSPDRPAEKYAIYRATTYTGALVCRKMNANAVYQIAKP